MPTLFGLARVGRDAELRTTPGGDAVLNVSLAFNYGKKDVATGKRPSQWLDASMWGKRAEMMAQYLLKGTAVSVVIEDAHIETFARADGTQGTKLVGRIGHLDLASGGEKAAAPPPPPPPPPRSSATFADMDDDVPF